MYTVMMDALREWVKGNNWYLACTTKSANMTEEKYLTPNGQPVVIHITKDGNIGSINKVDSFNCGG